MKMTRSIEVHRIREGVLLEKCSDEVAVEEPLELRVEGQPVAVAMRTPGHDRELAAGWAFSEGIVRRREDILEITLRPGADREPGGMGDVMLRDPARFDVVKHRRNVLTNASCGLCSAASIDTILRDFPPVASKFQINVAVLHALPARLHEGQLAFQKTGGLHACALFDAEGMLVTLREDVGRHNALDKLIGWALLEGHTPLESSILLLSGRVSLEMIQKALAASIPIVAAIGAPSSLAVDLARRSGVCLAAFLRGASLNIYAGAERLRGAGGL
jgi:FdhD protein